MPINYQPPSPVSPYTSAAYGRAEEFDKFAPILQAAHAQQLQAGIAGAQAYNQGGAEVTARTIAAGQQNTQLEGLHQSQLFQAQQQQAEYAQQQQMQYAQQEQAAAQQRKQNEDTINAKYQEMTQAENLHLQRLREADSWIDEQHLDPEIAQSMHARVRGIRGPLELKADQAQTKIAEAHATLFKQQADLQHQQELKMAKIEAMTMDERTKHTYDPAVVAQVMQDMGPAPQGGGLGGAVGQAAYAAELKRRVEADPNGIMATHVIQPDGKLVEIKRPNAHADRQVQDVEAAKRHWQSSYTEQSKEVEAAISRDAKAGVTNRENWTAEGKNEAIRNRMQVAVGAPTLEAYLGNVLGGKSRPPHVPGSKFAMQGVEGQAAPPPQPVQAQQSQPDTPAPAPFRDETPQKPFAVRDMDKASPEQKVFVQYWDDLRARAHEARPDAADRKGTNEAVNWAINALERYGSPANMAKQDPQAFAHYEQLRKFFMATPPPPKPNRFVDPGTHAQAPGLGG